MGFLRGAAVTVLAIVLLIALFFMNLSLTLTWSLEYETLQPNLRDSVRIFANEQLDIDSYIAEGLPLMEIYCQTNSEFVFNQQGYTFVLPCDTINQGSEAVINYGIDTLIEQLYYTEYECEFIECLKETDTLFVLVSETAHDFWQNKFRIFLIVSIALFALMFILANHRSSTFIVSGILLIISALPFIKLKWAASLIPEAFRGIFLSFFTKSYNVSLVMFMVGGIIFLLGIALHFFKLGRKIANFFTKGEEKEDTYSKDDVKKIIKRKEQSKKKFSEKIFSFRKKSSEEAPSTKTQVPLQKIPPQPKTPPKKQPEVKTKQATPVKNQKTK